MRNVEVRAIHGDDGQVYVSVLDLALQINHDVTTAKDHPEISAEDALLAVIRNLEMIHAS